jgi:transcriptional regulator with XRE-family HTH domain
MQVNRIRELRKQIKMTQKELAKYLRIADSTLSYWEIGKYEPDYDSLRKLSDFFHVPIGYILCDAFTEWDIAKDGIFYPDVRASLQTGADISVSDSTVAYNATPGDDYSINSTTTFNRLNESGDSSSTDAKNPVSVLSDTGNIHRAKDAFNRNEFKGLTLEEIDRLAEYAEFIKAQRMKRKSVD